jgi:para-nitrobenzyl esterase
MDEDCLYLNVWTPSATTGAARPVMVWLHGGAFHFGSCASPSTDGSRLARRGDVVVVSLNHRLNVFGFLHLQDALGDETEFAGHAGMLDIVQALRWVRENIASFGGDPDQVTVFGESGGGRKVSVLMSMLQAKGLFHRAIVQSGAHPRLVPRTLADRFARGLLANLPGSSAQAPASLQALQAMPAAQLFEATVRHITSVNDAALPASPGARWLVMSPVHDGLHLADHPFDPAAPAGRDVPLLIGTTKDESALFLARSTDPALIDETAMRERVQALLGARADELLAAHEKARPGESPWTRLVALSSEDRRLLSIETAEQKLRQGGAPVYMYWFTWETDVPWLMSAHTLEIPFVFDTVDASPITGSNPHRQALADQLCDTWVAFARTGRPVHDGLPYWPAYQLPERSTMVLDLPLRLVQDPRADERRAWIGPVPMPWEPGASVGAV